MKKKHFFLKLSIIFAFAYWLLESAIHYFLYGEFEFTIIPSDINELSMRLIIFVLLIVFGLFADYHTKKSTIQHEEKHDVYIAMLKATHHILNNFLNNMILFKNEAEDSKDFNKDML